MNKDEVGKLIATKRKEKKLTQQDLAKKLNVAKTLVSKWERGLELPSAKLVLEIAKILDIELNDLFTEKRSGKEEYMKKAKESLNELKETNTTNIKRLLNTEIIILTITVISFVLLILAGCYVEEALMKYLFITGGIVVFVTGIISAMYIEQYAGYYECEMCGHTYIPTTLQVWLSIHIFRTRLMKCPKCNNTSWAKKVISD